MKEILGKQSKETRCYIMSAIMVFEGFQPINPMTEIHDEMLLDVLGLTKLDIESFPLPGCSQIIDHLKPSSDLEVKQRIYHDMPGWQERSIKHELIGYYGRKYYYQYHNGSRLITPDVLQQIEAVCLSHGWTAPLHFDDYVEDYAW